MGKGGGLIPWFLYVLVRLAAMLLDIFALELNLRTARWAAGVWWRLNPKRRERACAHLRGAYGDTLSESEVQRIAFESVKNLAMFGVEVIQTPRLLNERTWTRHIRLKKFEEALGVLLSGKGAVLLTGHYGNWELMGYALAMVGFDMTAVMRPLDNEYLNNFLVRVRGRKGLRLLFKRGATESAEELLRNGGAVGFIADQDAGRKGLFVDFFGRPASTYKSIGLLAMASHVPIIIGYCRRVGHGFDYEMGVQRIIYPGEWVGQEDALRWITQEYTYQLELIVRDAPEQYLWLHRRWKSQPGQRRKKRTVALPEVNTETAPT